MQNAAFALWKVCEDRFTDGSPDYRAVYHDPDGREVVIACLDEKQANAVVNLLNETAWTDVN